VSDGDRLQDPKFWTVAEAARVMRVSKMTVYRLVHGGELKSIRVGRAFRIPDTAVRHFLAQAAYDPSGQGPALAEGTREDTPDPGIPGGGSIDGARLRRLRAQKGLTQEQLARLAGLRRQTVISLERGHQRSFHARTITRLAAALAAEPDELTRASPT